MTLTARDINCAINFPHEENPIQNPDVHGGNMAPQNAFRRLCLPFQLFCSNIKSGLQMPTMASYGTVCHVRCPVLAVGLRSRGKEFERMQVSLLSRHHNCWVPTFPWTVELEGDFCVSNGVGNIHHRSFDSTRITARCNTMLFLTSSGETRETTFEDRVNTMPSTLHT